MDIFDYLLPVGLVAVTLTLAVGIFALFKGGDFGRSYSNKLMRLRIVLQFGVIIVLVTAWWWRSHAH
ncbi:MAG TPA: twin transmembrane helix small protein [Caulobacteraceae bacterium]